MSDQAIAGCAPLYDGRPLSYLAVGPEDGGLVLLGDQDRSLWNMSRIAEGRR